MNTEQFQKAQRILTELNYLRDFKDKAQKCSELELSSNFRNPITFKEGRAEHDFYFQTSFPSNPELEGFVKEVILEEIQSCLSAVAKRLEREIKKLEKEFASI